MNEQHPITPPPELVQQWYNECPEANEASLPYVATQAARWGADQELEACCEWLSNRSSLTEKLRDVRRPKPPSLKEQALAVLDDAYGRLDAAVDDVYGWLDAAHENILRRALEQLDD